MKYGWGNGASDFGLPDGPMGCRLLVNGIETREAVDYVDTDSGEYRVLLRDITGEYILDESETEIVREMRRAEKLEVI